MNTELDRLHRVQRLRRTIGAGLTAALSTVFLSAFIGPLLGWASFAHALLSGIIAGFLVLIVYNCLAMRQT